MKCSILCKLLTLLAICSIFEANATDITTDKLSEKRPLQAYAEYTVQDIGVPLQSIISQDNWLPEIPQLGSLKAVWLRVPLRNKVDSVRQITLLVEEDIPTELYVGTHEIPPLHYAVESLWQKQGIKYFYDFELNQFANYLYLKVLPKQVPIPGVFGDNYEAIPTGFYLENTQNFKIQLSRLNSENEATRRMVFLIIGGLGVISLISLLIGFFWRRKLFFYYFIYGFAPFLLLISKEFFFTILVNSSSFQPYINTLSRAVEFLQLVSIAAYILFVTELLDIKKTQPKFYQVLNLLAIAMILQGVVEVAWLIFTSNIEGYDVLVSWSSSILFPIFIGVIIWMSIFIRHHLAKYVIASNTIFIGMLLLGFLRFNILGDSGIPVYLDPFFKLPFATLIEMVVFSFAIAAKIAHGNELRIESEKQLRETEMMALRSQMNPHFIFNSLNTIRNFILQSDNQNANKYLSKFSKLLRGILSYSRSNIINLTDELETVRLYLELESARFETGFYYEINIPENIETDAILIPPLLLQPYVENAIWHGLRNSEKPEKIVRIDLVEQGNSLTVSILDNGIGRAEAQKIGSQNKESLGTKITQERIELFNLNESSTLRVETKDVVSGGTEVVLTYKLY